MGDRDLPVLRQLERAMDSYYSDPNRNKSTAAAAKVEREKKQDQIEKKAKQDAVNEYKEYRESLGMKSRC